MEHACQGSISHLEASHICADSLSRLQWHEFLQQTTPILWTFFEILVPLLTFVIAKLRKLPKAAKRKAV